MKRLYEKNELYFALLWIAAYVVVMNIALQFCGGFDNLETKTVAQMLVPVGCILFLSVFATVWIIRNDLTSRYGFGRLKGSRANKGYLWYIPLIVMSCINLINGMELTAPVLVALLMMLNMAAAGYVEEIIFRGFLFRAMQKENLNSAIIVSAVTFGVGHIVNLANTADTLGVILQVCYAIAIGFLYTVIVYKSCSLWPCILSHIFVNASSVIAREDGMFTKMLTDVFGQNALVLEQIISAVLIILAASSYALWIWHKAE